MDVEFFPFDEQYCQMKFGSWTFNGRQVTLEWYEDYRQASTALAIILIFYVLEWQFVPFRCAAENRTEYYGRI